MPLFRATLLPALLLTLTPLCLMAPRAEAQTSATATTSGAAANVQSGPMVGYVDMREAALWVQTRGSALVQFSYWPQNQPDQTARTPAVLTQPEDAFAVTLIAGGLQPGTTYQYELVVDGQKVQPGYATTFSTPPNYRDRTPPPDFTIALGGGNYVNDKPFDPPNRIPGDSYQIMAAIMAKDPAFMLWLGNNVYLREADWGSKSGMLARYRHNRSLPEMQPLLASVPSVATWSAHDFGPPQADSLFLGRKHAQEAFRTYWPNPDYGTTEELGMACTVRWGDAEFFLLDDRSFRDLTSLSEENKEILGEQQMKWLLNALRQSTATFKVIVMGEPMLNPVDSPDNYTVAKTERDKLIQQLTWSEVEGLFFVSGGKPFGELTKRVRAGAPDIYEVTVGPMTGRPAEDTGELNYFRVPGTTVFERQFATLRFHGAENARQLTVTVFDVNGTPKWTRTFSRSEMGE